MSKLVVHIEPSSELESRLKAVQDEIAPQVKSLQDPLHLTLYCSRFTDERAIVSALKNIQQAPFALATDEFDHFDDDVFVIRVNSVGARALHSQVIEALRPYLNRAEISAPIQPAGFEENVRRYGTPYVGKLYTPHITLATAVNDVRRPPFIVWPPIEMHQWTADKFVLSKSVNGKYERLEEFKLKF